VQNKALPNSDSKESSIFPSRHVAFDWPPPTLGAPIRNILCLQPWITAKLPKGLRVLRVEGVSSPSACTSKDSMKLNASTNSS